MNREEAIKMLQSGWEQTGYYTADFDVNKVADLFIKHEQDTLKEFVEWYKSKVIKDRIQISKEQKEYCNEIDEPIKAILWEHEGKVLQRISYCIDEDLENFIKSTYCDNKGSTPQ